MVLESNNNVNELNLVKSQLDASSNSAQNELIGLVPSDPQVKASSG